MHAYSPLSSNGYCVNAIGRGVRQPCGEQQSLSRLCLMPGARAQVPLPPPTAGACTTWPSQVTTFDEAIDVIFSAFGAKPAARCGAYSTEHERLRMLAIEVQVRTCLESLLQSQASTMSEQQEARDRKRSEVLANQASRRAMLNSRTRSQLTSPRLALPEACVAMAIENANPNTMQMEADVATCEGSAEKATVDPELERPAPELDRPVPIGVEEPTLDTVRRNILAVQKRLSQPLLQTEDVNGLSPLSPRFPDSSMEMWDSVKVNPPSSPTPRIPQPAGFTSPATELPRSSAPTDDDAGLRLQAWATNSMLRRMVA
jgi:hypothetical protein